MIARLCPKEIGKKSCKFMNEWFNKYRTISLSRTFVTCQTVNSSFSWQHIYCRKQQRRFFSSFFFSPRVPFLFRAKWQPLLVEAISSAYFIHLANRSPSALVLQLTQKNLHNIVVYFSTFLGYFIKKVGHVERKLNPQFKKWGSFHLLPVFISVLSKVYRIDRVQHVAQQCTTTNSKECFLFLSLALQQNCGPFVSMKETVCTDSFFGFFSTTTAKPLKISDTALKFGPEW